MAEANLNVSFLWNCEKSLFEFPLQRKKCNFYNILKQNELVEVNLKQIANLLIPCEIPYIGNFSRGFRVRDLPEIGKNRHSEK